MKSIKVLVLAVILLAIACKKDDPIHPNPSNLQEEIENIIQPMVNSKNTVGAAVGIIKPGGDMELFFFGEKTKGQGDTPDENTLFEIGSINKTMTGAVLADMVLHGEVSLDDAVADYLPGIADFPDYNGEKITFKHLANHTSSLPRMPGNSSPVAADNPFASYTKDMLYDFLDGYSLPRPIGSAEEYSNLAFGLLGHTLAEMRGASFDQQLHDVVFDRLGMHNTFTLAPANYTNIAQPYNDQRKAVVPWDFSDVMLGAGGVRSSLKDMLKYLEANMGYGSSDLKDALAFSHQNTQTLNDPVGTGLAWINAYNAANNSTLTQHNGRTSGSNAFIGFIKELDMGVVLLFNTDVPGRVGELGYETRKAVEIFEAMQKY
jgi:CubicO group peptidase (beta-lactamase class C family)